MKRKLILLVAVALSFFVKATPADLFDEANKLYQQNQFTEAQVLYDSLVSSGYQHAETFYNLGNVHYRLGNVGLAI